MMKTNLLTILASLATLPIGLGQTTYTWTGAVDGDWTKSGNWDGNGVPVDSQADDPGDDYTHGLSLPPADKITFNVGGANPVPTTNIPELGGNVGHDTPKIELLQGGAIDFNQLDGREGAIWTNVTGSNPLVWKIGDGIGVAGEVELTIGSKNAYAQFGRHNNNINNFEVNSDGILNLTCSRTAFGANTARTVKLTIAGGEVNLTGSVDNLTAFPLATVEFSALNGTFTAAYGDDFANLADVQASLGTDFVGGAGIGLQAVDNGSSFTVSSVPGAAIPFWAGSAGATWDQSSTSNFTTNDSGDPLVVDTFANAISGNSEPVTFADEYAHSDGGPTAVTQTTVTIDAAGVSSPSNIIRFTNSVVSYDVGTAGSVGISGATPVLINGGGSVTLSGPNTHTATTTVTGSTLTLADELALQNSTLSTDTAPVFDDSVGGNAFTLGGLNSAANIALENNAGSPAGIQLTLGNNDSSSTYAATMSGAGGLTKVGTGTFTLDGQTSSYTGDTVIKEGTLRAGPGNADFGISPASAIHLGEIGGTADATLQFDQSSSTTYTNTSLTVQSDNSGIATLNSHGNTTLSNLVVTLGSGTTGADVRIAEIGNAAWSFKFLGVIQDPIGMTPGEGGTVTIGGIGNVNFEAANTYSGHTVVESGKFNIQPTGALSFYPTTNGSTNQLKGAAPSTGAVTFNGELYLNLTGADATAGNMWPLIIDTDLASLTYGGTFHVDSTSGVFTEDAGVWTLEDGLNIWSFDEATGILSLELDGGDNFWTGLGGATWDAATTANFSINIPSDPISNTTFDVATATSMEATFADTYWDNGVMVAVAENDLSIAAGGVETGELIFTNNSVNYSVDSTDANGIKGATALSLEGTGMVTLTGTHAYTGTTQIAVGSTLEIGDGVTDGSIAGSTSIVNDGALSFDATNGVGSLIAALSGSGTFEKKGVDTLTLLGNGTSTGVTTVSGGTLQVGNGGSTGAIGTGGIVNNASLVYDLDTSGIATLPAGVTGSGNLSATASEVILNGDITQSGSVTLAETSGSAGLYSGITVGAANTTLTAASIDLSGDVGKRDGVGHSFNLDTSATNGTIDLDVSLGRAGQFFQLTSFSANAGTGTINITGAGPDSSGWRDTPVTITGALNMTGGVNSQASVTVDTNGTSTGTVSGGFSSTMSLTKTGTGTLTLSGVNGHTGNTTVSGGTLTLADGGRLTLAPTTNGTNNQIGGTGAVNLDGEIYFNLSGADTSDGNSWLIVDVTNLAETYGGTFTVNSSVSSFAESSGIWTLSDSGNLWTFSEASGILTVEADAGTPFEAWATGGESFEGDANGDGVQDGLAFLLGAANPSTDANGLLPVISQNGGDLVLTFSMLNAANRGDSSLATQHSFDLGVTDLWEDNEAAVPEATSVVGVVDFVIMSNGSLNDVIATIPGSEGAGGKLFGRLLGTE